MKWIGTDNDLDSLKRGWRLENNFISTIDFLTLNAKGKNKNYCT